MRFKKIILLILVMISLILTSCRGSREVDELGIVIATAVDIEGEDIILTHEVIIPKPNASDSNTDSPNITYVQSRGETVMDAIRNATLLFDRKLFLAHNRVLIFGEDLAKRGIGDYINFYTTDNEPRESTLMVVARGAKGYEVMGINGGLSDTPGEYLYDLMENYRFSLKTRNLTLNEYLRYFLQGLNPVIPIVERIEQTEIDKELDKPAKDTLNVMGGAVFNGDKLIGYYGGDEMKGFNFIVDEFENGLIIFETSDELVKESAVIATTGELTTVEITKSKTKKSIEIIEDKLVLRINVNVKASLVENKKGINADDKDILEEIKKACSRKIEEYIVMTMDKAQGELRLDTFSIGNMVRIEYPHIWKEIKDNWEGIFPNLDYTVDVSTDLIRTGLLNTPVNIRKEKE